MRDIQQVWKILLVDDDEEDYLLTRDMLMSGPKGKTEVTWASTFETGLTALLKEYYTAVLIDYDLGDHNGLDLVRKAVELDYPAPFLLLTGRDHPSLGQEASQAGVCLYLRKGDLSPGLLSQVIQLAIEHKPSTSREPPAAAPPPTLLTRPFPRAAETFPRPPLNLSWLGFSPILDRLPEGVLICDPRGQVSYVNPAYLNLVGIPPEQVSGLATSLLGRAVEPSGKALALQDHPLMQALKGNETPPRPVRLLRQDGAYVDVRISAIPLRNADGSPAGAAMLWVEENRAGPGSAGLPGEDPAAGLGWLLSHAQGDPHNTRPKNRLVPPVYGELSDLNTTRVVLNAAGEILLRDIVTDYLDILDTSATVFELNGDYALGMQTSGWCRYLDTASRALIPDPDNRVALASGQWLCHEACWTQTAQVAITSGRPQDQACPGGLRIYALPITAEGEPIGAISIGYGAPPRDPQAVEEIARRYHVPPSQLEKITLTTEPLPPYRVELAQKRLASSARLLGALVERKRVESKLLDHETRLNQALRNLNRSNEELENFAFMASHDLQEPLRKIRAFGNRLGQSLGEEMTPESRDYLTRMLKAASRMQEMIEGLLALSRVMINPQPFTQVDLQEMVREVVTDHEDEIRALGGGVEVGSLPTVEADPAQMNQLLQNLIGNALKYHRPDIPPRIQVSARIEEGIPRRVQVRIADNGIGFEKTNNERIFQPFVRLRPMTTYQGSGMGLAICRRILEHHNGQISAESTPGEGSVFTFTLPLQQTSPAAKPGGERYEAAA